MSEARLRTIEPPLSLLAMPEKALGEAGEQGKFPSKELSFVEQANGREVLDYPTVQERGFIRDRHRNCVHPIAE